MPKRSSRTLDAERLARIFSALADPTRLRILNLLLSSPDHLRGSDIARKLNISMALLCHHWNVLADAGIILKQRSGQSRYCSLNRDLLSDSLQSLI